MLFVSLVILIVLSLLAISTANTAIVENKVVSATRDMQLAQLAAGSAISEAKARIEESANGYGARNACTYIRCLAATSAVPFDATDIMRAYAGSPTENTFRVDLTQLDGADLSARLAAPPTYIIEDMGSRTSATPVQHVFRIVARGVGATPSVDHVSEIVYVLPE